MDLTPGRADTALLTCSAYSHMHAQWLSEFLSSVYLLSPFLLEASPALLFQVRSKMTARSLKSSPYHPESTHHMVEKLAWLTGQVQRLQLCFLDEIGSYQVPCLLRLSYFLLDPLHSFLNVLKSKG